MYVTEDVTAIRRAELGQRCSSRPGVCSARRGPRGTLQEVAELTVPALADWCGSTCPGPAARPARRRRAREPGRWRSRTAARAPAAPRRRGRGRDRDPDGPRCGSTSTPRCCARPPPTRSSWSRSGRSAAAVLSVPLRSGETCWGRSRSSPRRRTGGSTRGPGGGGGARAARRGRAAQRAAAARPRRRSRTCSPRASVPTRRRGCRAARWPRVYRPAGEGVQAGGDFYEVVDAPGGSIVVMGDVVGKGAPAAALSAVARVTLRTAGRLTGDRARRWTSSTRCCAGAAG